MLSQNANDGIGQQLLENMEVEVEEAKEQEPKPIPSMPS